MDIMCGVPATANNCSIPVTDNTVYNISVTARNIVGNSEPVTISRGKVIVIINSLILFIKQRLILVISVSHMKLVLIMLLFTVQQHLTVHQLVTVKYKSMEGMKVVQCSLIMKLVLLFLI